MYCPFSYVLEECRSEAEHGKPMCAYCLTFSIYSDTHPGAKYITHNLHVPPNSKRPTMDIKSKGGSGTSGALLQIAFCSQLQKSIKKESAQPHLTTLSF